MAFLHEIKSFVLVIRDAAILLFSALSFCDAAAANPAPLPDYELITYGIGGATFQYALRIDRIHNNISQCVANYNAQPGAFGGCSILKDFPVNPKRKLLMTGTSPAEKSAVLWIIDVDTGAVTVCLSLSNRCEILKEVR